LDIISLTLTLHLLERFEGVEARPGLEFEPDTRSRKDVTPLTACPCRFSMREGRPNVLGEDLLGSVATMLPTLRWHPSRILHADGEAVAVVARAFTPGGVQLQHFGHVGEDEPGLLVILDLHVRRSEERRVGKEGTS